MRLLTRFLRPKRSNETAELVEGVRGEDKDCTPRRFGSNSGTAPYRHDIRFVSTSSDPRSPKSAIGARDIRSASADAIHRTAAIHGRSRGHRRARDRPRAQNDTRSYGAANGIGDILAVDDGASPFRARGDEASYQERKYQDREFHFDLSGVGGSKCAPRANRPPEANRQRTCEAGDGPGGPFDTDQGNSYFVSWLAISDRSPPRCLSDIGLDRLSCQSRARTT
jgi:hypothetical protein